MTNYLVTGGAGFIGSHIVQTLLARGARVRVLDNFSTGKRENLAGLSGELELMEGDLRDSSTVQRAVKDVQNIFHEAAFVSVPQSMQEPQACLDVNVRGTENLLEAARKARVRRVVFASSAAVYGEADAWPLLESTPLNSLSPYAAAKQIKEIYADLYTRAFGLDVVGLRYFNVYGPRQHPESMYAAAVPIFVRRLLDNKPIMILGDGGQSRDLIYVGDVVRVSQFVKRYKKHVAVDGVDLNIGQARARVGDKVALQGNMDPVALYAKPEVIRAKVKHILEKYGSGSGHVFNLGHGILPDINPEHVGAMVDAVHRFSPLYHQR